MDGKRSGGERGNRTYPGRSDVCRFLFGEPIKNLWKTVTRTYGNRLVQRISSEKLNMMGSDG